MYYYIKEEYGNDERIKIYLSQVEADIMIGSLIKHLNVKDPNDLTIISTDCDMFVVGYGYNI